MGAVTQVLAEWRRRCAAMAAWLNREPWGRCYTLPDGNLFPQPEPNIVLEEARRWVSDVVDCGWDLQRWREKHSEDWQRLNGGLSLYRPSLILGPRWEPMYFFEPDTGDLLPSHWWAFAELMMNPERERLGRCDRCGRFYVSEGRYRRKRYCSRRCAHAVAANRYLGRRYAAYRERRLALARRLLRRWRPRYGDWKAWLVAQSQSGPARLTRNFLTRCVAKGEITPPSGQFKQRR
jgi:hypothetical protein